MTTVISVTALQLWNLGERLPRSPGAKRPTMKARPAGGPEDLIVVRLARPTQVFVNPLKPKFLIQYQGTNGQLIGQVQLVDGDTRFEIVPEETQND